jgi:hypothetical protein
MVFSESGGHLANKSRSWRLISSAWSRYPNAVSLGRKGLTGELSEV